LILTDRRDSHRSHTHSLVNSLFVSSQAAIPRMAL
jgi:hypothetical protein